MPPEKFGTIAVNDKGDILVTYPGRINVYLSEYQFHVIRQHRYHQVSHLCVDQVTGYTYYIHSETNEVFSLDKNMAMRAHWKSETGDCAAFLATNKGSLYVAFKGGRKIAVLDSKTLELKTTFETSFHGNAVISGMAFDNTNERVMVFARGMHAQVFSFSGKFIEVIGKDSLYKWEDVKTDEYGNLLCMQNDKVFIMLDKDWM